MDQYNSKLNVKYNGMCDTDKFDFFFRHSTPKFFRPKRKKAPRHCYFEDHLVVTTGFYGPRVTLKVFNCT